MSWATLALLGVPLAGPSGAPAFRTEHLTGCMASTHGHQGFVARHVPIVEWIRGYRWGTWLTLDLVAGISVASPLGLYTEEFETSTGRHLGNFPQAFSHLALIEAAGRIIIAERLPEYTS